MQKSSEQAVQLVGQGEEAAWTRRALEREGFVVQPTAKMKVEVLANNDQFSWMLTENATSQELASIYQLIAGIRQR